MTNQHGGRFETAGDSNSLDILEVHLEEAEPGSNVLQVEVTLNVGTDAFEGLAGFFACDGSRSMFLSGMYPDPESTTGNGGGFLAKARRLASGHGQDESEGPVYPVTKVLREVVPFMSELDATGTCGLIYWACSDGTAIEDLGEVNAEQGRRMFYNGPRRPGSSTHLLPAIRHFVKYIQNQAGTQVGCGVFVTDGVIHDIDAVIEYVYGTLGPAIANGQFPRSTMCIIGVGPEVSEDQLERLEHETTDEALGIREIIHAEPAATIGQLPEIVAHLVPLGMTAFTGGATVVVEGTEQVVANYEDEVPAVLQLSVPRGVTSLVIRRPSGDEMAFSIPAEH